MEIEYYKKKTPNGTKHIIIQRAYHTCRVVDNYAYGIANYLTNDNNKLGGSGSPQSEETLKIDGFVKCSKAEAVAFLPEKAQMIKDDKFWKELDKQEQETLRQLIQTGTIPKLGK